MKRFRYKPMAASAMRAISIAIFTAVLNLPAQTFYGSIVGAVTDASGAPIPAAPVILINTGTSERRARDTDSGGNYQFVNLVPGHYRLDIEKQGFKHLTRDEIVVEVQAAVRIDVSMQVGDMTQTIEVQAQTPLLQTETTSLGAVVESRKVQEMPLNGRNVLNLVALVPGVVPGGNTMQNPIIGNNTGWGNYQIGGGMANQSAGFLDGGSLNVGYVNMIALVPAQDSIQEFRVQTNNLSAEFGRFAGGVVNLTSKSGTNEIHGSAYEFLRNKVLNANTFFNNRSGVPTPAFTQNQFGATAGGPIRKDKTFLFFGYEGFRLAQGRSVLATVPTDDFRAGNFSNLRDAKGSLIPIFDPQTTCGALNNPACAAGQASTRTPFPNNIIPASRLDPTAKVMTGLWAEPNAAGQPFTGILNFAVNVGAPKTTDQYNARIDQNISAKQRVFGRYTDWTLDSPPSDTFGTRTGAHNWQAARQAVLADTYTFTPTTIADFRVAFLRYEFNNVAQSVPIDVATFGWPAILNQQMGAFRRVPYPIVQGYPDVLNTSAISFITDRNNSYSIAPTLTKIAGRHTLKFGGEWRALQFNFAQSNNTTGNFTFDNLFTAINPYAPAGTGYGFASFMLGLGASGSAVQSALTAGQQIYQGYFATDTLQLTRKLTLNFGVRWELPGPWTERYDRETVLLPDAESPLAGPTGLPLKGKLGVVNSPDRPSRYNQDYHKNLFAPRLGFAYRLTNTTVVRGGYGIFYLPNDITFASGPYGSPVNNTTTTWVPTLDGELTPAAPLSNPFPNGIIQPPGHNPSFQNLLLGQSVSALLTKDPYPYTQQWNFDVQRQFSEGTAVEVGYAGSKGVHLPGSTQQLDQLPDQYLSLGSKLQQQVPNPFYGLIASGTLSSPTVPYGQLLRPYPQYNGFSVIGTASRNSIYHSLQVKGEKRFSEGGAFLVAYTYAKFISDTDTLTTWLEGAVAGVQNYHNISAERAVVSQDVPHRLVASYVLDLPVGKGKRFLTGATGLPGKLVSGWGVNGVVTLQSGFPLGMTTASNLTNSFGGGSRPNSNGQSALLGGSAQSRLNQWFNTADFNQPAAFSFGNVGRNLSDVRSHGINNWDVSLFKTTRVTERIGLQFRAEFFNFFNRVQFGLPGTALGNAQFGVVSSQSNNPRLIQFGLRLSY
jgi:hypothetical protein